MKTCRQCLQTKDSSCFYPQRRICKQCKSANSANDVKLRGDWKTPKGAYTRQKARAKHRGVEWQFTFSSWWEMWEPYWDNRGRRSTELCMARIGDVGPYSPDNVKIVTNEENHLCVV